MKTKTDTREWSDKSFNCVSGCENDCKYCYAKHNNKRFGMHKGKWADEVKVDDIKKAQRKYNGIVMFHTTHDITKSNYRHCLGNLITLLEHGNKVLVVSKMSSFIAIKMKAFSIKKWVDKLEFRISITSADGRNYFEPYAPVIDDRLAALQILQGYGFKTSVSMEPMLSDPQEVIQALKDVCVYDACDSIWIGCMNHYKLNPAVPEEKKVIELYKIENLKRISEQYKDDPKIKFKDSFMRRLNVNNKKI